MSWLAKKTILAPKPQLCYQEIYLDIEPSQINSKLAAIYGRKLNSQSRHVIPVSQLGNERENHCKTKSKTITKIHPKSHCKSEGCFLSQQFLSVCTHRRCKSQNPDCLQFRASSKNFSLRDMMHVKSMSCRRGTRATSMSAEIDQLFLSSQTKSRLEKAKK